MTPVAILPISTASGEKSYRAIAGDRHSVGKTAGQALDALTDQLAETEFSALLIIQNFHPDLFFTADQQARLTELMGVWRIAQDQGQELPSELQVELDALVEIEQQAAIDRTAMMMKQLNL